MRVVRIYQSEIYAPGQIYTLSPDAGQHVGVVLRMQPGEVLTLFNGQNQEFTAVIDTVHKKQVSVKIESIQDVSRESPRSIHLAQAIAKGDRMEWLIQKSVELGVASIQPILTERCAVKLDQERLLKKNLQWQAMVISACEQCGRNQIPPIFVPLTLDDYLIQSKADIKFILHPEENQGWRDYDLHSGEIALLIGPEGGFSPAELKRAKAANFSPLRLGPRVLRTETAGIAALSFLQAFIGDL